MTAPGPDDAASQTAELVARRSYGKLLAVLAARSRDVTASEDALAEAFATALERWPRDGVPANPEGWLLTVARRRAIDESRRETTGEQARDHLRLLTDPALEPDEKAGLVDERLAMLFVCAHPEIDAGARAPLMLQVVLGLDARTIAAAFLTSPAAMSKRLVRAKSRIRDGGIPLQVPEAEELSGQLTPVLDAIYAAFTEGWSDPGGVDVHRRDLAEEALFLADLIVQLLPGAGEAQGLLALMLYAEARRGARRSDEGEFVPFEHQDQGRWDWTMIRRANEVLSQAGTSGPPGRYQLEAALQSAHLLRRATGVPNWVAVLALYDGLFTLTGSPVVLLNRALALAEVEGAGAGLAALDEIAADLRLASYEPWWVARAELYSRLGRSPEARQAWGMAIGLERDPAVRRFLQNRLDTVAE